MPAKTGLTQPELTKPELTEPGLTELGPTADAVLADRPAAVEPNRQPAPLLAAEGLTLAYDKRVIVRDLSVRVPQGKVTVIVGANGCGKSTLLRGLARLLKPKSGTVTLDGADIKSLAGRSFARSVGVLPQQPLAPEGITVSDLVGRGRHPHHSLLSRWGPDDDRAVAHALAATHVEALAGRRVDELSGGQRQRVWIAMMLAQDPAIMLLDEPTTYLDIAHQIEVLDLLAELNETRGSTIVMVLHDLALAARYAHQLIVMSEGRIRQEGPPHAVLTEQTVRDAFGLEALIFPDPVTGSPMLAPRARPLSHGVLG